MWIFVHGSVKEGVIIVSVHLAENGNHKWIKKGSLTSFQTFQKRKNVFLMLHCSIFTCSMSLLLCQQLGLHYVKQVFNFLNVFLFTKYLKYTITSVDFRNLTYFALKWQFRIILNYDSWACLSLLAQIRNC